MVTECTKISFPFIQGVAYIDAVQVSFVGKRQNVSVTKESRAALSCGQRDCRRLMVKGLNEKGWKLETKEHIL